MTETIKEADSPIEISVVIPLCNEQDSIGPLLTQLVEVLDGTERSYEIICVDDGSSDDTYDRVHGQMEQFPAIRCLKLARNFGQTAAIMAGIDHASGAVIVMMDGDGQNDPADVPRLLAKLDEGFDVVSGWRIGRRDRFDRVLVSRIANSIASAIFGMRLRDFGCTLKVYRREVLLNVRIYGEQHRFIPVFAHWEGARIAELQVSHHPRRFGRSHYGYRRIVKVILDILLIRYLHRYLQRPLHLFGSVGILFLLGAMVAGSYAFWLKFGKGESFIETPLPVVTVMLGAVGVLALLMGLLAEIIVRTYYESQNRRPYALHPLPPERSKKRVRD